MGKIKRNKINGGLINWLYQKEELLWLIKENVEHTGKYLRSLLQDVQIVMNLNYLIEHAPIADSIKVDRL